MEYETDNIYCPACGKIIGKMTSINSLPVLQVGPLMVQSLHATCECGFDFHWSINAKLLEHLVNRVLTKTP